MNEKFDLEKRLKAVELAKINGMFMSRDDDVVDEATKWFLTPFSERGDDPPINRKTKRLIRMLFRLID